METIKKLVKLKADQRSLSDQVSDLYLDYDSLCDRINVLNDEIAMMAGQYGIDAKRGELQRAIDKRRHVSAEINEIRKKQAAVEDEVYIQEKILEYVD